MRKTGGRAQARSPQSILGHGLWRYPPQPPSPAPANDFFTSSRNWSYGGTPCLANSETIIFGYRERQTPAASSGSRHVLLPAAGN